MEGSDGGAAGSFHDPASCHTEFALSSPSQIAAAPSSASPVCLPSQDFASSEASEDRPLGDALPSHSEASSDRLSQHPSVDSSSHFPWRDLSSSSALQLPGDMSSHLRANASAEPLGQNTSSSHLLSSLGVSSSHQLINDTLANEHSDEKAHHSSHKTSPMHSERDLFLSEAPAEELLENPSVEAGSFSFNEGSRAEPSPAISANQTSHVNSLEQLPPSMSANHLVEASREEDSDCTPEEQELPDDAKREMLKQKCKGVEILLCNSESTGGPSYVYLIGTAHVSEESCREVRSAISLMKPEVVFVELCQSRAFILRRAHFLSPTVSDMVAAWKEGRSNLLGILYSWFLAKVAAKLDVLPGSEFRAAYEEATACGAKVVLGDRDIEVTLRRTWSKMSIWHKTKFIFTMIFQAFCLPKADQLNELIEKLKDADMLTIAFEELGKSFPTVMETLIDERDMFMAAVLQKLGEDNTSIVAVVGRGHVAGIIKHWGQDIPIHTLLQIPQKRPIWNTSFKLYFVAALVALTSVILFVYYRSGS